MIEEYKFEVDEYNYHAVAMIFGIGSPKMKYLSEYSLESLRKHKDIKFSEVTSLNTDSHLETKRRLKIDDYRYIITDHTELRSGINKVIHYSDNDLNVNISDALFCDIDVEYFENNWDRIVQSKVHTVGILIRVVHERKKIDVPLLINDFPNITKILLKYQNLWLDA